MSNTNTNAETQINNLFIQLENVTKWSQSLNIRSLFGAEDMREACSTVFGETLEEIAILQKRIIRTLLQNGMVGELEGHMMAGTFPQYAIHRALGRRVGGEQWGVAA